MLEHVPAWLGGLLKSVRAGHAKLVVASLDLPAGLPAITLSSPAFADGAPLPVRFTADGAGVSPPLAWTGLPQGTKALALIVEDPDAPAPQPLVHAVVALAADVAHLPEGAIAPDGDGDAQADVGRNSFLREGWLPPDPPTGHGPHDYVFQLFALGTAPTLAATPGRAAIVEALKGRVIGVGLMTGTYERGATAVASSNDLAAAT